MFCRKLVVAGLIFFSFTASPFAAPIIDPIPNVSIPAGKSLTLPITSASPNGRPLSYTISSSTNRITVEVHTNNPFWKLSVVQTAPLNAPDAYQTPFRGTVATVTNVGDMTLMLFRDRAPKTVDVFQGFSMAGFYNSNTVFHRVILGFMIQGGDPQTNGTGGPVFRYDDEFHPRAIFSGHGQLALANSGKDTCGSQFFITQGPQRFLDFGYTLFGQLLRGFNVLTNVINTPRNASDHPWAEVIITRASFVTNYTDTVITLTGTNLGGVVGTIQVIADDGLVGGRVTNSFTATTVSDAILDQSFLYPNTVTNLVAPVNVSLTNFVSGTNLSGGTNYLFDYWGDYNSTNTTLNITNGLLIVRPNTNFAGSTSHYLIASTNSLWAYYYSNFGVIIAAYDLQRFDFTFGDTSIAASGMNFTTSPESAFTNILLATFTNGIANSSTGSFTASINWGDNSLSAGLIVTNTSGRKEVRGAHTYTNSGHYPIYIAIQSTLGVQASVVATAYVQPSLKFTRTGNTNLLRWPAWATDYQPQIHTNLATTNWSTVTNLPTLVGYDMVVTNIFSGSNAFFRLKR